ncbi:MAG: hypothetical protein ABSH09_14865 [Bryobacteraceae bacterium]
MRAIQVFSTAVLLLIPAAAGTAFGQEQREQEKQPEQKKERQAKPAQQPQRAQEQQRSSGTQRAGTQQAAAHGRIPDDRFRASFGSGHTFHVSRSQFAGSSRRFQYGGYWFAAVDAWPVGWLCTDSVYVDYRNGGYFLCDPIHPGVFLSISIG